LTCIPVQSCKQSQLGMHPAYQTVIYSRPKHVENRNKHTRKNCAPCWLY